MAHVDPKELAQKTACGGCPKSGSVWRHYKGGLYEIVAAAVIEATLEVCVVYRSLKHGTVWVRPLPNWQETVEADGKSVPRFVWVGDAEEMKMAAVDPVDLVRQLDAESILQHLERNDAERKALLVLRRAALHMERK